MNADDARRSARQRGSVPVSLLLGVVVLLAGVAVFGLVQLRISDRVSHGVEVHAVVSKVDRYPRGKLGSPVLRLHVRYDVGGQQRTAALMALISGDRHAAGEEVGVYVSTSHTSDVATGDEYASEGWLTQIPAVLMAVGLALTVSRIHAMRHARRQAVVSR